MNIASTKQPSNTASVKASFSSLELNQAKQQLKENPCIGVKTPIYDGIPEYMRKMQERTAELYDQAKKSIDIIA